LLLDEHFDERLARLLRDLGFDVVAAVSRGLSGTADEGVLGDAAGDRRAVVSNDLRDFVRLARRWAEAQQEHFGIILVSEASIPRKPRYVGRYVDALAEFCSAHQGDNELLNQVHWLHAPRC
jgi:predicted nuclease of predicted toxin-antitoxin system